MKVMVPLKAEMMLFPYVYAIMVVAAQAKNFGGKYCEVSGDDDPTKQCYQKETLVTMTHSPNQLAVDTSTNTLYFSFDAGQGEYTAAVYKMDTKEMTVLKGVNDAFAIAYDSNSSEIYFGGSNGIYKYHSAHRTLRRLNIKNLDIWWLFIKNYVYFIKFPSLNTYAYVNGTIKLIEELKDNVIHQLVVDVDNIKFFINNSGLYGIMEGKGAELLKDSPRFLNMATDNNGFVHVCSEDGIYVITKIVTRVKRILSLQGILGFTFDKDNNLIYSNSHEIIRLIPVKTETKDNSPEKKYESKYLPGFQPAQLDTYTYKKREWLNLE